MKILLVNHTARVSGAEHALLDLLAAFTDEVDARLLCPEGDLARRARATGVCVDTFMGTEAGLRLHPWHTGVALIRALGSVLGILRSSRAHGAQLVHANSLRAALLAVVARTLGGPPVLAHVHDRLPPSRLNRFITRTLQRHCAALVAISRYTSEPFEAPPPAAPVYVAYNPLDLERFDPTRLSRDDARRALGLTSRPVLGLVAQITPWKGQDHAVRLLGELRKKHPAIRLLLVGEPKFTAATTRFDNPAYLRELHDLVRALGLGEAVTFLGERGDVPRIMRALDVLLVPSWEEPFGRAMIEAMAMETPVVATARGGPSEVIADGVTGRLVPPRELDQWVRAVDDLLVDEAARQLMGSRTRRVVAARFGRADFADQITGSYRKALM
jgi:glycosyltransferase involved in cell wall biosynthesis